MQLTTIPRCNLTPAERAYIKNKYARFGLARFALPMLRGRLDVDTDADLLAKIIEDYEAKYGRAVYNDVLVAQIAQHVASDSTKPTQQALA